MDFVFKPTSNGLQFVGDFEGLYQTCPDPWEQSGERGEVSTYYAMSRARLISMINRHSHSIKNVNKRGLEIGCGHGHVTNLLNQSGSMSAVTWDGMDISPSAIGKASLLHENITFFVDDITGELDPSFNQRYDIVVLGQMFWYIIHDLSSALLNIYHMLRPGGVFVISQAYLEKDQQQYGTHIADGFNGTVKLFVNHFQGLFHLIETRYDDSNTYIHHDGLLVFRKVPPDAFNGSHQKKST